MADPDDGQPDGCATTGTDECRPMLYLELHAGHRHPGPDVTVGEYAAFFQDDFRITPKLTVNLGMRWEYQHLPITVLSNTSTVVIPP